MSDLPQGVVDIRGKQYHTVAKRVHDFRLGYPMWGIHTDLVHQDDEKVIMRCCITDEQDRVIGTGYAEEVRASSKINKTSALENAETSAIGRALAACGILGEHYASADEVEAAIKAQEDQEREAERHRHYLQQVRNAFRDAEGAVGRQRAMECLAETCGCVIGNPAQIPQHQLPDCVEALTNLAEGAAE